MPSGRHPKKDIEAILRLAEGREPYSGVVTVPRKAFWKLKCSGPQKHLATVQRASSDPNYGKNLRAWLERQSCWNAERPGDVDEVV